MKYYVSIPLNRYEFSMGKNPEIRDTKGQPYFTEQSECIKMRDLAQFEYCGDTVGSIIFTCDKEPVKGIDATSVTNVSIQTFDYKSKASVTYTMDIQNGEIDWEKLRIAKYAIENAGERGNYSKVPPEVTVDETYGCSLATQRVMDEIYRAPNNQMKYMGYSSTLVSREPTEMMRICDGIKKSPPYYGFDKEAVPQKVLDILMHPKDELEWAAGQFSTVTDIASLKLRDAWTIEYNQHIANGVNRNEAAALAMFRASTEALNGCHGPTDYSEDLYVLEAIKDGAIESLKEMGYTDAELQEMVQDIDVGDEPR